MPRPIHTQIMPGTYLLRIRSVSAPYLLHSFAILIDLERVWRKDGENTFSPFFSAFPEICRNFELSEHDRFSFTPSLH